MSAQRSKMKGRREHGSFSAWPHACAQHPNFAVLSIPARALLFEFLGQLRGSNNGDLCCAYSVLRHRGWRSRDTIERARAELEHTGWILRTRQGGRNTPNLYAVTWLSIDACKGKLDVPAGPPPVTWRNQVDMPESRATLAREKVNACPRAGQRGPKVARQAA